MYQTDNVENYGSIPVWDAYLDGATLIVEFVRYHAEGETWYREELHSVVGLEPYPISTICTGPNDRSPVYGPAIHEHCRHCTANRDHTEAVCRFARLEL